MIMKQFKPAMLVITGIALSALISVTGCNADSKKSEPVVPTKDSPVVAPAPATTDTPKLEDMNTRPVKTPN